MPEINLNNNFPNVTVYGGCQGNATTDEQKKDCVYHVATRRLGELLAKRKVNLWYGGSDIGLLGAVSNAFRKAKDEVSKIVAIALEKYGHLYSQHPEDIEVVRKNIFARKKALHEHSDVIIATPGGTGTLDELFNSIEQRKTYNENKKIGLLNINGYFDSLIKFLKEAVEKSFIKKEVVENIVVEDNPETLLNKLLPATA